MSLAELFTIKQTWRLRCARRDKLRRTPHPSAGSGQAHHASRFTDNGAAMTATQRRGVPASSWVRDFVRGNSMDEKEDELVITL